MDISTQKKPPFSSLSVNVEKGFKIACIDDRPANVHVPQDVLETRRKRIHDWAKTKISSSKREDLGQRKLYRPLLDKYEIRVLEIKPGKPSDQLKGALHHCSVEFEFERNRKAPWERHAFRIHDLTVPISYTALSYTWGAPEFDAEFECDGCVKMITRSLESALRHFRQEDQTVVLWIDQICIDQSNNEEKAQQVQIMSKIYVNAINTAVWLGDSADASNRALRLLITAHMCLHFSMDQIVDPSDFERMGLPKQDSGDWKALWKLLARPWFDRLWIIQEVALSKEVWVVCGKSVINWESLSFACLQLADTGISQWLTEQFSTSVETSHGRDLCKKALYLETIRMRFVTRERDTRLLTFMIDSRRALCMDARDKVYGMFGICQTDTIDRVRVDYSGAYNAAQLYQDILEEHITAEISHNWGILDEMLPAVDHDSAGLPSWVADWTRPRRTTALGSSVFSYHTDGRLTPRFAKQSVVAKVDSTNPAWKELQVSGLHFSTLEALSGVFENPDLSATAENKTLQEMLQFVVNLKDYPSPNTDFAAFWKTLVAGKDERRMQECPDSFAEIFSYTLDLTTGKKDSISGQTYTRRQGLPKGRGGLDEDKFKSRKPKSAGDTFRRVRTALINATKNRRLGYTVNGYIGLFPEHAQVGDGVFVLMGCFLPCILRVRDDEKFKFVGGCYVHGIMGGEAIGPNPELQDIILA